MDQLRVRLFGELQVSFEGRRLAPFQGQKAKSLFAFLVLNRGRPVHRDVLCGRLWGDRTDAEARKALRTALWRMRQVLQPVGATCLQVQGGQVAFVGPAWVDVHEFERCLHEPEPRAPGAGGDIELPHERLTRAANLYRADLLDGIYEDWCQLDRERLRLAHLETLERLLDCHHGRREWREAIAWGSRLLHWDPLREHVHRLLMVSHLANGDRPSALRQYQSCARVLAEELGVDPMPETQRLHQSIRDGSALFPAFPSALDLGSSLRAGDVEGLARSVQGAIDDLRSVLGRLERAAALAEGASRPDPIAPTPTQRRRNYATS